MGVIVQIDGVDVTGMVERFTTSRRVNTVGVCAISMVDVEGTYRPHPFDSVTIDVDEDRVFAGTLARVKMGTVGDDTIRAMTVWGRNANALAQRQIMNTILPAGTLKEALTVIETHLGAFGVTLAAGQADGPDLDEIGLPWQTCEQALNYLSRVTGWLWEIDDNSLELSMWAIGSRSAPTSFSEANENIDGGLGWEQENLDYRNAQWVIFGGAQTLEKTDRFEGNGSTRLFPLRYWVGERPGQVYDEQASAYRNVGIKGEDTAFEWVWDAANGRIEQLDEAPPGTAHNALTVGEFIQVSYVAQFPMAVYVEDAGEITANGAYVRADTADHITDVDAAEALAQALIDQSVTAPQQVVLPTRTVGNDPGEVCTVTVPEQDLSGSYLIESEDIVYYPLPGVDLGDEDEDLGGHYYLQVKLGLTGGGARQESWIDWWKAKLGEGGSSGGGAASGGLSGSVSAGSGRVFADLGGSRTEVVRGAMLATPVPNHRAVYLDPAWFTAGVATVRVEVQSLDAGTTVTPQLRRLDTDAVVVGGSATASGTFETQVLSATLPAATTYALYLVRSDDDASARGLGYLHG